MTLYRFKTFWAMAFIFISIIHLSTFAETIVLSNLDDTILEGRSSKSGTFKTRFVLFRIDQRATVLQPELNEHPKEIEITSSDFHRIKRFLARKNSEPGPIGLRVTLEDGRSMTPGIYTLRPVESYKYYLASGNSRNYLLEDFKAAEASDPSKGWRGPFWNQMVKMLSTPETARNFGIITARGHSEADWRGFFKYLKQQGYIENLPNFNLIFSVGQPHYDELSLTAEIAHQKASVLERIVQQIKRLPTQKNNLILNADGDALVDNHYLVFAENTQIILDKVFQLFRRLAQSRAFPIKFALYNTGTVTEVRNSHRPQFSIVQSSGTTRSATKSELLILNNNLCTKLFGGM